MPAPRPPRECSRPPSPRSGPPTGGWCAGRWSGSGSCTGWTAGGGGRRTCECSPQTGGGRQERERPQDEHQQSRNRPGCRAKLRRAEHLQSSSSPWKKWGCHGRIRYLDLVDGALVDALNGSEPVQQHLADTGGPAPRQAGAADRSRSRTEAACGPGPGRVRRRLLS